MLDIYRMFVRPEGAPGEFGADLMERNGRPMADQAVVRLELKPTDSVIEVGFGPGLGLEALSLAVPQGCVIGVDPSPLMHRRASARNATAIREGRMTLVEGTVDALPFETACFDAALAVDNLHFWPDPFAGLMELRRVLRRNSPVLCAFTPPAGGKKAGLNELFIRAGFTDVVLVDSPAGITIRGHAPS
ncbi:MAG TPA: class I SAM-dependent methyltransferase [Ensifer sp.]|nr:class I SAM-dependent methyltransferase [Ensifer sp.]